MSKLAIVLCAAAFFASALAAIPRQNYSGEELKLRIDRAVTTIDKRIHEVRTHADALVEKPVQKSIKYVADFEKNVTDYMDGVYKLMALLIKNGKNVPNEMECRSYFDSYEKLVKDVLANVNDISQGAVTSTYNSLEASIREATEVQKTIRGLEVQANACGRECENVSDTIDRAVADVSRKIDAVLEDYTKLVSGTTIKEAVHTQTKYDRFREIEDEAWNKFTNCIFAASPRSNTPKN